MRFGTEFARQSKPRPKWPGFLSLQHGRDIGKRIISVGRQGDAISECRDSLEVATNVDQLTINCEWVIRRSMMCGLTTASTCVRLARRWSRRLSRVVMSIESQRDRHNPVKPTGGFADREIPPAP